MHESGAVSDPTIEAVGVVGAGLIGRSWTYLLARAGCRVRVFDPISAQRDRALSWMEQELDQEIDADTLSPEAVADVRSRVTYHDTLVGALRGVGYVQESGPEAIELKRSLYEGLDAAAAHGVILASSTSAHDMTPIAAGLSGASRCIVAHPVNPPHVVPVVEVLPGRETDPDVADRTCKFLRSVGQAPVRLNFWVDGFLLNRMQKALLSEAINLVERGVASVDAVDSVIRDGLGLRWALMGPFGVAETNADGGTREYLTRFRANHVRVSKDLGPPPNFDDEQIERVGRGTDEMLKGAQHDALSRWRDRMIRKIRALKEGDPQP